MWVGGFIGAVMGAIGGGISAYNENQRRKEEARQTKNQIENAKTALTNEYNYNRTVLNNQYDRSVIDINSQIGAESASRDMNALASAASNVNADKNDRMQLENAIISGTQSRGALVQNAAVSGFRNTEGTTTRRGIELGSERIENQIALSRENYNLSVSQRFLSARVSYLNSELRLESYRNQLARNENDFNLQSDYMQSQYQFQMDEYNDQITYYSDVIEDIDSNGWFDVLTGVITMGASGASSGADIWSMFA